MIILVTLVCFAMSLQENCGKHHFGNCDPGQGCTNWDPKTFTTKCFECSDGGYSTRSYECDGFIDCKNGQDEHYFCH